ncbi:MAG: hypothetical protein AAB074_19850 [Planctomycetota bacterium]
MPWTAAAAALLAGALAAGGVEWTVAVRSAEVKEKASGLSRGTSQLSHGEDVDGVLEGDWVRLTEKEHQGYIHRTALAAEGEELKDPFLSIRIAGTFYPEDVQAADQAANDWVQNPTVRDTGRAPSAWALEEFREQGGLRGPK